MWIQRVSGTLSGFSVPSGKHACPALQGPQARPLFGVSGAATLVFLLAPVQNLAGVWAEGRSLWSAANALSIYYLEDVVGCP